MNVNAIRTCIRRSDTNHANGELFEIFTVKTDGIEREVWTRQYWGLFPQDERGFISFARSPGISIWIAFFFSPSVQIQSQYAGVSVNKLCRISRQIEPNSPCRFHEALQKYLADKQIWDLEYEEAYRSVLAELPEPPYGFTWHSDMGGIISTRIAGGKSVPIDLHFRVWRPDLGYMPCSE